MASTYSTSLKIQEIGNGEQAGVWGNTTNTNWQLIEQAVAGVQTITMSNANYTLTNLNGVLDEARNMVLVVQGTNSGIYQVIAPLNQPKMYVISNQTTGGYAITIGASSGSVVSIPNGTTAQVYTDGTNFFSAQTGSAGDFKVNGNFTVTGNQTDTGNLTVSGTFTANNAATFAVSPTAPTPTTGDNTTKVATTAFVTSAIPTFGTMATQNANAVAITGGTITGLSSALPVASGGTGVTTSTGSGAIVLNTSPTISNPTISNPTISSGSITFSDSSTQASSVSVLGIGGSAQTWQALIGSRNSGTSYTNSTGKPIMVVFNNQSSGTSTYTIVVQGVTIVNTNGIPNTATYTFIVPIGASYSITWTNGGSNLTWSELR